MSFNVQAAVDAGIAAEVAEAIAPLRTEIVALKVEIVTLKARIAELEDDEAPPPPPPPPPTPSFPDASTTGVPAGVTLTVVSGGLNTSSNGQVIDAKDVRGTIIVSHDNVTVKNTKAQIVFVEGGRSGVKLHDSTIVGGGWNSGVNLLGPGAEVLRCNISGVENGIWLSGSNSVIKDNYLHHMTGSASAHIDGVQIPGGSGVRDVVISHNNFDLGVPNTSSCITMKDATNVDITLNRLNGGSFVIYFEGNTTACDVTQNTFVANAFGWVAGQSVNQQTYSGNMTANGAALPLP